jgi:hypothetical protein
MNPKVNRIVLSQRSDKKRSAICVGRLGEKAFPCTSATAQGKNGRQVALK